MRLEWEIPAGRIEVRKLQKVQNRDLRRDNNGN